MSKKYKIMPMLAIVILLAAGIVLFAGCEKDGKNIKINGKVVAILDGCVGNEMIITAMNNSHIGSNHDTYGNKYFIIGNDTVFTYNNVIAVPLPIDSKGVARYYWNNTRLSSISVNDEITFVCRQIVNSDSCFVNNQPCLAIWGSPSNIDRYVITRIINYKKF